MHIAPPRRPAAAIQAALATIRAEVEARAADPKNENCGFILDDLGVLEHSIKMAAESGELGCMDMQHTLPTIEVARGNVRRLGLEHGGIVAQIASKQKQLAAAVAHRVLDRILSPALHDNSWLIDKLRADLRRLETMRDAALVELRSAMWTLDAVQRERAV